jgi:hypothetical protein
MPVKVEISGLKEALANLKQLSKDIQGEITRKALREALWEGFAKPMRGATYTTFNRQTGRIRSGIGVIVQAQENNEALKAFVTQYPQSIAGTSAAQQLFRAHMRLKGHRPRAKDSSSDRGLRVDLSGVAYWWRFLEFGTGPRHQQRTPKFLRSGRIAQSPKRQTRQLRAATAWQASPSRGGITSRSWLRPIEQARGPTAVDILRRTVLAEIEKHANDYPK